MSKNTTTFGPAIEEPSILNPLGNTAVTSPAPLPAAAVKTLDDLASTGDPLRDLQIEELRFRLAEMKQKRAEQETRENQLKQMRIQNMALIKRRQLEEAREKEFCSHKDEHGGPNTVGTRDHRGNVIVMCQTCRKEWRRGPMWTSDPAYDPQGHERKALPHGIVGYSERLPREIYPKADAIGGPSHV